MIQLFTSPISCANMLQLILYSKPGCHLCEGLEEKLAQISRIAIALEIRDITTRADWFETYQYEIPVLYLVPNSQSPDFAEPIRLPRLSPRSTVLQLESLLQKYQDVVQ